MGVGEMKWPYDLVLLFVGGLLRPPPPPFCLILNFSYQCAFSLRILPESWLGLERFLLCFFGGNSRVWFGMTGGGCFDEMVFLVCFFFFFFCVTCRCSR